MGYPTMHRAGISWMAALASLDEQRDVAGPVRVTMAGTEIAIPDLEKQVALFVRGRGWTVVLPTNGPCHGTVIGDELAFTRMLTAASRFARQTPWLHSQTRPAT